MVHELKRGEKSITFSAVSDHQKAWLKACKHGVVCYKISDSSYGLKPFDGITFIKAPAYVVLYFNSTKLYYFIDIDDFLNEEKFCGRKSVTSERADLLSFVKVKI